MGKIICCCALMMSLSGCVFFWGEKAVIGFGEKNIEYYEDGSLKSVELKGNSPLKDIVSVGME